MNACVDQYKNNIERAEKVLAGGIGQIPARPDMQVGQRYLSEKCLAFLKYQGNAIGEATIYGNYLAERLEAKDLDLRQSRLAESMLSNVSKAIEKLTGGIAAANAKINNVNACKGRLDTNYDLDLLDHFKQHDEARVEIADSLIGCRAYVGAMRNPELAAVAEATPVVEKSAPSMKTIARYVSIRQGLQKAIERLHGNQQDDASTVTMVNTIMAALRTSDRLVNMMSSSQSSGLKQEFGPVMEKHLSALEAAAPFFEQLFDGNSENLGDMLRRLGESTSAASAALATRAPEYAGLTT